MCVCMCMCMYVYVYAYMYMCMRYLVLIEEVLLKTVMFDVEQFEWRGIDQATRWHFELTKSKPGYAVHHNTRSLDIHTQNTYSSAPSRGSSCEPNYYQNRYKQHPKYGSCGLTLQIKRFRIESKNLVINRNNVTVPNLLPTHVTTIHAPSLPQLKFPCSRRIARRFSFPPRVRIKWIRLDLLKTQNVGFSHFHKV